MLCSYSTHSNLSVSYNLGASAGVMLALQIGSGILIAMSYVASAEQAFLTLDAMLRDSTYGWCIRAVHSNCASTVFLFMYLHAVRAWMYAATVRVHASVWIAGLAAWLSMMAVAFMGYVLP